MTQRCCGTCVWPSKEQTLRGDENSRVCLAPIPFWVEFRRMVGPTYGTNCAMWVSPDQRDAALKVEAVAG